MKYLSERQNLLDTMKRMEASELGSGTSGNLSLRVDAGFLITPSAMRSDECSAEDMVLLNHQGDNQESRKPSSEWRFHRDIYSNFPEAGGVVHTHAPACTTLACLNREIPAFHYMIAMAGGNNIRCAPYATFGTEELSQNVVEALKDRKACLLANHGMLCHDKSLDSAFDLAIEIEALAEIYSNTLKIGEPAILDEQEMNLIIEKFSNYKPAK